MHSAGSGPFKMRVYQPHQAIVLDANPLSNDAPKIANIIIKNVPDPASRRLLIQQGDADIARGLGADQTSALQNQAGINVMSIPSAEQNYLAFNTGNTANPLLANPALWEAARYLVDYKGITQDLLKGQYFVHQSFLPVGFNGALENNPFSFDPAKAKAILEKAGIKMPPLRWMLKQSAVYHRGSIHSSQLRARRRESGSAACGRQSGLCTRACASASGRDPHVAAGLFRCAFQRQRFCLQR